VYVSSADLQSMLDELTGRHHPNFVSASKNDKDYVRFEFKEFTGAEPEPDLPAAQWNDPALSTAARNLLADEHHAARRLWHDARYMSRLQDAANGATGTWTAYTRARQAMADAFTALCTAPGTHWKAAVLTLVAAQDAALDAAQMWDRTARAIADVHAAHLHGNLIRPEALDRLGVDHTNWDVRTVEDYRRQGRSPLHRDVWETVETQREQLRSAVALAGDREQSAA
jgi:hypothetical protein